MSSFARLAAAAIGALISFLSVPANAQSDGPLPEDGYYEVVEPIEPGVWLIRQEKPFHLQPIGNVVVIEQSDGLVLVDSGGSPGSGRRIVGLIRSVSAKPVKAVVLTHWHGDHPLGLSAVRDAWPGLEVIATETTRDRLLGESMQDYPKGAPDAALEAQFMQRMDEIGGFLDQTLARPDLSQADAAGWAAAKRQFAQYRTDVRGLYLVPPTRTYVDRLVLKDRVRPVEVRFLGKANTDGDSVIWLPRQRIVASGDLLVAPIPFGFGSYPAEWLAALEALRALRPKVVIPGHGAAMRDLSYVDRVAGLIRTTRERVAPLAAEGLSLEETQSRVDLSDQAEAFVGSDPWLRRWFKSYWVTPFVESAWKEARGEPIVQGRG